MGRFIPLRRELATTLSGLQTELNRLFEDYVNPARIGPSAADAEPSAWTPAVDVIETPEELVVVADLPGVDPSTIDLTVTGNVLNLRGDKPVGGVPAGNLLAQERATGCFHRAVSLSSDVNFDAAQAESHHGVLTVRLPKKEAAKPRTIPVQPR